MRHEPTELVDLTTCMVPVPFPGMPGLYKPCGQKFSSPRVTILGDNNARLNQYMAALAKHLADKHPEVGLLMAQHGAAFMEMIFLRNFKTTDPELTEQQDRVRWQIHQQTLKSRYPDEAADSDALGLADAIVNRIASSDECGSLFDTAHARPLVQEMLAEAFRSIRDALEEPGKYATPEVPSKLAV